MSDADGPTFSVPRSGGRDALEPRRDGEDAVPPAAGVARAVAAGPDLKRRPVAPPPPARAKSARGPAPWRHPPIKFPPCPSAFHLPALSCTAAHHKRRLRRMVASTARPGSPHTVVPPASSRNPARWTMRAQRTSFPQPPALLWFPAFDRALLCSPGAFQVSSFVGRQTPQARRASRGRALPATAGQHRLCLRDKPDGWSEDQAGHGISSLYPREKAAPGSPLGFSPSSSSALGVPLASFTAPLLPAGKRSGLTRPHRFTSARLFGHARSRNLPTVLCPPRPTWGRKAGKEFA